MSPRELPGFYYDEAKGKYFRIQKNHVSPAGSGHTVSSVKELKEQKESKIRLEKHTKKLHQGLIKCSILRRSTAILDYRICPHGSPRTLVVNHYASQLTSRPAICANYHAESLRPELATFGESFSIHPSGRLAAAVILRVSRRGRGTYFHDISIEPASRILPGYYAFILAAPALEQLDPIFGSMKSLSDHPYLAIEAARAIVTTHNNRITWRHNVPYSTQPVSIPIPFDDIGIDHIWQLGASLLTDSSRLAIAADTGLFFLTTDSSLESFSAHCRNRNYNNGTLSSNQFHILNAPGLAFREQMTATFKNDHIVVSGERSGYLNFTDTRHPQTSISRLKHPSAIISTLPTEHDHLILVQGFRHISIYNLHHTKPVPRRDKASRPSIPHLKFPIAKDRRSTAYIAGGPKMAYSSELGLLAAASAHISSSTSQTYRVTLYSTTTGRTIPSPLNNHPFIHPVTCIEIRRLRDGPESIVTLSGGDLLEWTCHNDGEDEEESFIQREKRFAAMSLGQQYDMRVEAARAAWKSEATMTMAEEWERGNKGPIL